MLSDFGMVAEAAHRQDLTCCKHLDNQYLLSHVCSAFCPLAHTMNYIASAFTSRPNSTKSLEYGVNTPSDLDEPSVAEGLQESHVETPATSIVDLHTTPKTRSVSSRTRTKTAFRLCHPPPVHIHKQRLHIRPKVLLQLQRVSKASRPTPIFEVLPSVVFAPRLARHFPRAVKGKAGLGVDDLVIVSSEDYEAQELQSHDVDDLFEDKWDKREIIAAICQLGKDEYPYGQGETEICLNQGPSWIASQRRNGTYEFASTNENGNRTVARWVPKQARSDRTGSISSNSEEKKFNFSILNPNSRRHAVIATLDRQTIEVSDQYTHPSTSISSEASSTATTPASEEIKTPFPGSNLATRDPIEVDDALRTFITVTGIWVAFREGFSPNFRYGQPTQGLPTSPTSTFSHKHRSLSLNANQFNGNQLTTAKTPSPGLGNAKRTIIGLQNTVPNSTVPLSSYPPFTPPQRSVSTGSAFMQRLSGRKSSTPKVIQLSPLGDFDDSDNEEGVSRSTGSPLPRSSMSSREKREASLERGIAGLGLELGATVSQPTERATRRSSSRIRKIFGRSPKEREV